ncbi:MAG TPA: hypothetical protein VK705_12005 [Ferruginibacter sp.]|jgi:hypothetical protein|nr:hypothetical protein [Ferruginibacter sp.]
MGWISELRESMENKRTKAFTIMVVAILLIGFIYLIFNGKHNKLPFGAETNIPIDSPSNKSINLRDNNGTMNIDMK